MISSFQSSLMILGWKRKSKNLWERDIWLSSTDGSCSSCWQVLIFPKVTLSKVVITGRLPPDLDLSLLYDETVNFSQVHFIIFGTCEALTQMVQDFLMYSREKRLARKGRAETIPVDMAELLRSSRHLCLIEYEVLQLILHCSVMVEFTRELLKPHTPQKVMNVFEEISQFYFCEEKVEQQIFISFV